MMIANGASGAARADIKTAGNEGAHSALSPLAAAGKMIKVRAMLA